MPVLLSEVLEYLQPRLGEKYIDFTAGYGGHASRILTVTQNYKEAVLIDRDEFACEYLRKKFGAKAEDSMTSERSEVEAEAKTWTGNLSREDEADAEQKMANATPKIVNSDFYKAALLEIECGKKYDMILADFGVSSPQLDMGARGFSLMREGELDMRMDRRQSLTAGIVVNEWREREIVEILVKYGELSLGLARKYAGIIVAGRPWRGTVELATAIAGNWKGGRKHPATQVFQAIRIVVNDELGLIQRTLPLVPELLESGGRAGIITFHSLEDRLVKKYFREMTSFGEESVLEVVTKKLVVAEKSELVINPRARSAKLRVVRRK